jgi:hypothetical protein
MWARSATCSPLIVSATSPLIPSKTVTREGTACPKYHPIINTELAIHFDDGELSQCSSSRSGAADAELAA